MTALATSTDVEAVLGRTLTADESARVDASLAKASAAARARTGRLYEAGTHTVERRPRRGRVRLDTPTSVTSVVAVALDGSTSTIGGATLRGDSLYGVFVGVSSETTFNLPRVYDHVEITYVSAGTVPQEVVDVVAGMAARDLTSSVPGGATSYTVTKGPFSESATFDSPTEAVEPEPAEAAILNRHALRRIGPISSL